MTRLPGGGEAGKPAASLPPLWKRQTRVSERERWYSARHNAAEAKAEKSERARAELPGVSGSGKGVEAVGNRTREGGAIRAGESQGHRA